MKALLQLYVRLSARQQQIIRYVTYGYSNREISENIYTSKQVVADYLTVIYEEMEIALVNCKVRPNRPVLVHHFALLFQEYPNLLPDNERRKMRF